MNSTTKLAPVKHVGLGIEPAFWGDAREEGPDVILPLVRPD
ncbi:MAG TPA: hypothetical protein VFE78_27615 [Gemmataceae bacterium]|jgi:hypothetical protein|nr:hypothetical protein [Gemmataceae bacterium]